MRRYVNGASHISNEALHKKWGSAPQLLRSDKQVPHMPMLKLAYSRTELLEYCSYPKYRSCKLPCQDESQALPQVDESRRRGEIEYSIL